MVTYDNQPCIFLQQKKTPRYTCSPYFTIQFTELMYGFKDLLPDCIIYNNKTK